MRSMLRVPRSLGTARGASTPPITPCAPRPGASRPPRAPPPPRGGDGEGRVDAHDHPAPLLPVGLDGPPQLLRRPREGVGDDAPPLVHDHQARLFLPRLARPPSAPTGRE